MEITLDEAKKLKSWLEKKSPKTFGGYQKRYFRILDGDSIIYTDKDTDKYEIKGRVNIDTITNVSKKEDTKFRITVSGEDRVYHLKAKTKELRDKWVAAIELLMNAKAKQQKQQEKEEKEEEKEEKEEKEEQEDPHQRTSSVAISEHKIRVDVDASQSFDASSSIISNTTLNTSSNSAKKKDKSHSKYVKMNTKLLDKKGIHNLLSLSNPDIKKRFFSGFLKKGSKLDIKKKKFFVILFSSRPLRDSDYEKDDKMIDNSKLKEYLKFDTLFFFNVDKDDEKDPIKSLDLADCHSITCEDKD